MFSMNQLQNEQLLFSYSVSGSSRRIPRLQYTTICAPMVRYSKLPFRMLVRKYGCDLAFTPMIVSNSFVHSAKARDNEFTTCFGDRPLVVQFAANNATDLADAAELVAPYADGVDLNCGCPQRWALSEHYGAYLINNAELVKDMVLQTRNRISDQKFLISIKIRIHYDIRKTVDLCQKAQQAGVSFITIHGRTLEQRKEPVNIQAIKTVKDSLSIPVFGNGDVFSLKDADNLYEQTGVNGVMSARGLLQNPALFAGYHYTPRDCVQDWLDISLNLGTHFTSFHHHLMYMLEKIMPRPERRVFNTLSSTAAVLDYLQMNYDFC
ncbi:dihydrouridine synthase 4 isoform X1 [Tachypleus tridentatus]|uniref:dihydrouridine synthase 4 isoform X1 n=2 Tax=Tachypleus tridentatus TaxID=6853 RepID=UPI003FD2F691